MSLADSYRRRLPVLQAVADELQTALCDLLTDLPRIDRVSVRVKSEGRFIEKASRQNSKTGLDKYEYPLDEI
jgi:ppGpp synthetase/RelA/SpoT-type nucleotidyltranferase